MAQDQNGKLTITVRVFAPGDRQDAWSAINHELRVRDAVVVDCIECTQEEAQEIAAKMRLSNKGELRDALDFQWRGPVTL